jgi:hypothetical protein
MTRIRSNGTDRGGERRTQPGRITGGAKHIDPMRLLLAHFALGRMALHLGCMMRGGDPAFHLTGIRRELARFISACRRCLQSIRLK